MKKTKYILGLVILMLMTFGITSCDSDADSANFAADTGQSGSLARFTILNNYLYTVDYGKLNVFNIVDRENPVLVNSVQVGFDIETLFSYRHYLYIGSRTGMFIYDASNHEQPEYLSSVDHFRACDPVIANDTHAYVTLKGGNVCGTNLTVLQVYNVEDVEHPFLISQRNLIGPVGMAFYQDYLFVCDDEVKIFDISDPANVNLVHSIDASAFDVIITSSSAIFVGDQGIYQYSLDDTDITNINHLSTIAL